MQYSVIGSDGINYGPVGEETIHKWIQEGRVTAKTIIICEDGTKTEAAAVFPMLFARKDSLNWPGFFLAPFWGISHKLWQGWCVLACWILSVYFLFSFALRMNPSDILNNISAGMIYFCIFWLAGSWLSIYLLFRGKEQARKHRSFRDDNHFREVQYKWERACGIIILIYTALATFNVLQTIIFFAAK